jgi:ubiquitin-like 1-activating enzyme E1 A
VATVVLSCREVGRGLGLEVSPVAGIMGGMIGQEVVKAVSQKDDPIFNFFLFDGSTCQGTVNTIV